MTPLEEIITKTAEIESIFLLLFDGEGSGLSDLLETSMLSSMTTERNYKSIRNSVHRIIHIRNGVAHSEILPNSETVDTFHKWYDSVMRDIARFVKIRIEAAKNKQTESFKILTQKQIELEKKIEAIRDTSAWLDILDEKFNEI